MRKTIIGFMSTVSALVLLFSYHTSTNSRAAATSAISTTAAGAKTTSSTGTPSSVTSGTSASGGSTTSPGASTSTPAGSSGTYTGDAVNTRWGLVQVQITVENGAITAAQAIQYPTQNGKDLEINAYAVPRLNTEVTAAQSGSIDAVSGATVTSNGYIQSLQSAIDQANL